MEEEKELDDYLEQLQTVSHDIRGLQDDTEVVDMRLWDLLDDSLQDVQLTVCLLYRKYQIYFSLVTIFL